VKIVFADKDEVLRQLHRFITELKRTRPEVVMVGLFGSYATDTFGPASDVDLLIILRKSSKRFIDRIPDFIPENLSVGCDVFPYTSEEVEKMKQDGNHWIRRILGEVVWL
jgi:predicted nucleotidyltransferase